MILPTKYIPVEETHLGIGAHILQLLRGGPLAIPAIWRKLRNIPSVGTFDRMALALDLLFTLGAIEFSGRKIRRVQS